MEDNEKETRVESEIATSENEDVERDVEKRVRL